VAAFTESTLSRGVWRIVAPSAEAGEPSAWGPNWSGKRLKIGMPTASKLA
jgi:hypothetical protein